MRILEMLLKTFVFPGFLFLSLYSFALEFLDRKMYARMQSRVGPPWYQPLADFLKLVGKSALIPKDANPRMFAMMPLVALAAVAAGFVYVPLFSAQASFSFEGDLIIILYFLTIPPLALFLAGWYSRDAYATIGATRILTQLFAYEVPLFVSLLAPALLSDTWSLSGITAYYAAHPLYALINIPAAIVALISFQCKLERAPFDSPEAETEVVSGALVEYGGRLLALIRMMQDCELVFVISLFAAIFLPFLTGILWIDILLYFVKTLLTLFLLTLLRVSMARLRINNVISFCWKYLAPVALAQVIVNLLIRGVL